MPGLRPYSRMKDSGVAWFGIVPEHWKVLPNRAIFSEVNDRGHAKEQMLTVTISKGIIRQQELLEDSSKKDSSRLDRSGYKLVQPGDVAYNKMRAWQGALGVSDYRGIISPAYVVQRPGPNALARYLHYLLRTPAFSKEAERWSYGITSDMWSLRPEHFKMIYSCIPPLTEQTAIARFLDHIDRRIQKYIRAKEKLITLLEEYKQALIHQAVTGQIDVRTGEPYPEYKESGVEWRGGVPTHWHVLALRRRWSVTDCKHLTVPFVDCGFPLASVRQVRSFELDLSSANHTSREWFDVLTEGGRAPKVGDLIYCRNVSVGSAALVTTDEDIAMGQDVCLIRSKCEDQRWLNYYLHSNVMSDQLKVVLVGSTFNRINVEDIKALVILVPTIAEQGGIASFLDNGTKRLVALISNCRKQQDAMCEYRTRLISDVVTGKLDVREAAAEWPDTSSLAWEDGIDTNHNESRSHSAEHSIADEANA